MKKFLYVFIFLVIIPIDAIAANISADPPSCIYRVYINGEIKAGDALNLSEKLQNLHKLNKENGCNHPIGWARINSNGGDILESIAIGRLIRKNGMTVVVLRKSVCLSSCVFILAGGANRHADGGIGIHRPYFESLSHNLSVEQIRKVQIRNNALIISYLKEMDVSTQLLEDMLSIPPEHTKMLTAEQVSFYRLDVQDSSIEEKNNAQNAYVYGLTSGEYRTRFNQAIAVCREMHPDGNYNDACVPARILNISEKEASRRSTNGMACDDSNLNLFYECYRTAMIGKK